MTLAKIIEQVGGAVLMALVLLDVFFTVLYARIGTGIISSRVVARGTWLAVRALAKRTPSRRGKVLSFAGPIMLVILVLVWGIGLTLGSAFVLHPHMGSGIKASSGPTSTDFISALFAGGSSISFVGAGNFEPQIWRLHAVLPIQLTGGDVGDLAHSDLPDADLQRIAQPQLQSTFARHRHRQDWRRGRICRWPGAARTVRRWLYHPDPAGREHRERHGRTSLYPVLFYFRFEEPNYSMSRFANIALDAVTIIKTALDDKQYRWLIESGAVADIWNSSLLLLTALEETFISGDLPERASPDAQTRWRWRNRFLNTAARLQAAGIPLTADLNSAADRYISLRSEWSPHVRNLAPSMLYSLQEVDPAVFGPAREEHRRAA